MSNQRYRTPQHEGPLELRARRRAIAAGIALVGLLLAGAPSAVAQAGSPSAIGFAPGTGVAGTAVLVTAANLSEIDQVYFGNSNVGYPPVTFARLGLDVVYFNVPDLPTGSYQILLGREGAVDLETSACCFQIVDGPSSIPDNAPGCLQAGHNMQCSRFGTIRMQSQFDINGEPVKVRAIVTLNTVYADMDTRYILFSARNVTADGSPVTVALAKFATSAGNVAVTREDHESASDLKEWVDVLDTPVGMPIEFEMNIGSTDRGAFRLEMLVMAFDRAYKPIQDADGHEATLYTFTLLGVNKETGSTVSGNRGSILDGNKTPGPAPLEVLAVTLIALGASFAVRRRVV